MPSGARGVGRSAAGLSGASGSPRNIVEPVRVLWSLVKPVGAQWSPLEPQAVDSTSSAQVDLHIRARPGRAGWTGVAAPGGTRRTDATDGRLHRGYEPPQALGRAEEGAGEGSAEALGEREWGGSPGIRRR